MRNPVQVACKLLDEGLKGPSASGLIPPMYVTIFKVTLTVLVEKKKTVLNVDFGFNYPNMPQQRLVLQFQDII